MMVNHNIVETYTIEKEVTNIAKLAKSISTRDFACIEDAQMEIDKIISKDMKKINYHDISFNMRTEERRRRGRTSNNGIKTVPTYLYFLKVQSSPTNASIRFCNFIKQLYWINPFSIKIKNWP